MTTAGLRQVEPLLETQIGRDAMLRRLWLKSARSLTAPQVLCCVRFACVAICLATWPLQFVSLLGTSLPVTLAVAAALAAGLALGSRRIPIISRMAIGGFSATVLLQFALAGWMVISPQSISLIDASISVPGLIRLGAPYWNGFAVFGLALATLGVPAFVAAQLIVNTTTVPAGRARLELVFLSAAVGLSAWVGGLAQILTPYYCGLAAAGLGLALAAFESLKWSAPDSAAATDEPGAPAAEGRTWKLQWSAAMVMVASGGWIAALDRLLVQLSPGSIYLGCAEVIGLCLGIFCGLRLLRHSTSAARRLWPVAGLAAWGVLLLAAYPLLIDGSLWLNAHVSSAGLLLLARGGYCGLAVLPVGLAAAATLAPAAHNRSAPPATQFGTGFLTAVSGYYLVAVPLFQRVAPETILIGLAWLTLAAIAPAVWALRGELLCRWATRGIAAAVLTAVVLAPQWRGNFDPALTARLLFNSNMASAYRAGLKRQLLPGLDKGRHVSTSVGQRGIFTVWSYGGHQLQIRENGLPRGVLSTDSEAFPRYAPETLQTVVPCLMHGQTERLLLLGLGSGEALATALSFPIQEITCLETDPGLIRTLRRLHESNALPSLFDDDRVTLSVCDPALGLPAIPGEFDVVVSSPENLALSQAQPYVTAEFYRRAAAKLAPGGVFCQRLLHIDLGPRPVQAIVRTMLTVFEDVQAVEVAPGEMLFCATNAGARLTRPGLVSRLEAPHVRAVLGESGLDWTVPLNIAAVNHAGLKDFCREANGPVNSAANDRLTLSVPREMMRWAPKLAELKNALGRSVGRLLDWQNDETNSPVVIRRLAEVQGQQELMTKYADQYWAYRASLRDQVKEKPRSAIQLASAISEEKQMHPEDRTRVAYFAALGRAIRTHRKADIDLLAQLAQPYDPLVTYFMHQEAAELLSHSHERDLPAELRHRLHATFFSSPKDSSLRNVIAALTLLREHPECEPDPRGRWDACNALLQALKMRWEARAGVRPADLKEAIHDIDQTVLATEQTFHLLDELAPAAGISPEQWQARRGVLERTLISPVRSYQHELLSIANQGSRQAE